MLFYATSFHKLWEDFFDIAKRTCIASPFQFVLIKHSHLKLQLRGRPLRELRGRHVGSIPFFAL